MKLTSSFIGLALAGLLISVGGGCKKSESAPPPAVKDGVTIDVQKLKTALAANTSEEVQNGLRNFSLNLRYSKYVDAMMALDKMSADPSLTEPQKKIITEVMEQLKTAENNKNAAAPAPAAQ